MVSVIIMIYTIEHIASILKSARKARGLSQRALSAKVSVPQSHLSKVENGAVDLRVSSLVELARTLDLELMLVPRESASAVNAIVKASARDVPATTKSDRQTHRDLKRLHDGVARAMQIHPGVTELAQLQRQVRELQHFRQLLIPQEHLQAIRNAAAAIKAFQESTASLNLLRESLAQLGNLRNALAHALPTSRETGTLRPAYALDEENDG